MLEEPPRVQRLWKGNQNFVEFSKQKARSPNVSFGYFEKMIPAAVAPKTSPLFLLKVSLTKSMDISILSCLVFIQV